MPTLTLGALTWARVARDRRNKSDKLAMVASRAKADWLKTSRAWALRGNMLIAYRPAQPISKLMQYFKGMSSRLFLPEFQHLRKQFWGRHFWARGYLAVSSGTITDEMIHKYIVFCFYPSKPKIRLKPGKTTIFE